MKNILLISIFISFCLGSADLGHLTLIAQADNLRPISTSNNKNPGSPLPQIELQLLSKIVAHYPPKFWFDFLKVRKNRIDENTAKLINEQASLRYKATISVPTYPIPSPEKTYSLKSLIKIRDAYQLNRKRLNVIGLMEFYFMNSITGERVNFFYGARRGRFKMPKLSFNEAYDFAFGGVKRKKIKVILTNRGKTIYFSKDSPIVIIIDIGGNYFRVLDTSLQPQRTRDGMRYYMHPEESQRWYKGPYLSKFFHRVPLRTWSKREGRHYLTSTSEYEDITHFRILGTPPFPMELFFEKGESKKPTLTLLEIYDILKSKLDIEDLQICLNTGLPEKSLLRPDDWYIEISRDDKTARVYLRKEQFCFIQHLYGLREILSAVELRRAKLARPQKAQHGMKIQNPLDVNSLQKSNISLAAIDGSA